MSSGVIYHFIVTKQTDEMALVGNKLINVTLLVRIKTEISKRRDNPSYGVYPQDIMSVYNPIAKRVGYCKISRKDIKEIYKMKGWEKEK